MMSTTPLGSLRMAGDVANQLSDHRLQKYQHMSPKAGQYLRLLCLCPCFDIRIAVHRLLDRRHDIKPKRSGFNALSATVIRHCGHAYISPIISGRPRSAFRALAKRAMLSFNIQTMCKICSLRYATGFVFPVRKAAWRSA